MKILFDHPNPFLLAHGGFQIQIEQTKKALEEIGVEVEWLRWWDASQRGDVIHYFGRPDSTYIKFAHEKGMKIVMTALHGGLGARSSSARFAQRLIMETAKLLMPGTFTAKMAWDAYQASDVCIVLTAWESHLVQTMFGSPSERVHIVPNGVEEIFFFHDPDMS